MTYITDIFSSLSFFKASLHVIKFYWCIFYHEEKKCFKNFEIYIIYRRGHKPNMNRLRLTMT